MSTKIATYVSVKATDAQSGKTVFFTSRWRVAPGTPHQVKNYDGSVFRSYGACALNGVAELPYVKPELMHTFELATVTKAVCKISANILPLADRHFKGIACTYDVGDKYDTLELSQFLDKHPNTRIEHYTLVYDIGTVDTEELMNESVRATVNVIDGFTSFAFVTPGEFYRTCENSAFNGSVGSFHASVLAFPPVTRTTDIMRSLQAKRTLPPVSRSAHSRKPQGSFNRA